MGEELKKVKSKPPKTSDFDILHLSEHLDCYIVHNLRCYTRLLLVEDLFFFSQRLFLRPLSAQKEKKLNFTSIYPNLSRKTLRSPQYDIKAGPNQEFKVSVMFSHAVSSTSAPLISFSGFAGTKQRV